ncbi:MAG: hypothetical protein WBI07_13165 [Mobilitalea sp.]
MLNSKQIYEIDKLLQLNNLTIPNRTSRPVSSPGNADLPTLLTTKLDKINPFFVDNDNSDLVNVIDKYCIKCSITPAAFNRKSDLSRQCIHNFCNLKNPKFPNRNTLISILFALELPIDDVIDWMRKYGFVFPQKTGRDQILLCIHTYMIAQPNYTVRDINKYLYDRGATLLSQNSYKY